MVPRQGKRWDGTLASNNFRLKRGEDGAAYRKVTRRSEGVPFQDFSNSRGQFSTRGDTRTVFQTSWAGGALWNKPLLSDTSMNTYFVSEGLDVITEPGNMVAMPDTAQQSSSGDIHDSAIAIQVSANEIYYPEDSGTNQGLVKWDGSSFSVLTNDFGLSTVTPEGMCWDAKNLTVFALFGTKVRYVIPDSAGGATIDLADLDEVSAIYPGANIFMHFGRLIVWTGDILIEVFDASVAAANEVQQVDATALGSGTFTLTFEGLTSGDIDYNASAATVETALNQDVIAGATVVLDATSKWSITFTDPAQTDVEMMTAAETGAGNGALVTVTETTKGSAGPIATIIYNDNMGPDLSSNMASPSDQAIRRETMRLAIASSEGIWIVKNVNQEGTSVPFITRIDRTNDGLNVGVPVTSLPQNTMALDLTYHLGGLMISSATNMQRVYDNDISSFGYPTIVLYSIIEGRPATIGGVLGGIDPDEAPYRFLANDKTLVYFGGNKSVWVYDAVRGGLHRWFREEYSTATGGAFMSMVFTTDSGGAEVQQFSHYGSSIVIQKPTAATGGNVITHSVESNYFDFNIPAEAKTITHVTLMTDGVAATENWAIQISADDAAFATIANHTSSQNNTEKQRLSTVKTGFRFRYKLIWTAASSDVSNPSKIKGVVFHSLQGEMVTTWQLRVDGTEFSNVENLKVRPDDVLTYLETIAGTATVVTFVDEFKTSSSSHNVKVESVDINRSSPQEIDFAQVTLTEDT